MNHTCYLFESDYGNERIQILTFDLKYRDTIESDFYPQSIAVSSKTIGIHGYKTRKDGKIYFYDIKTKILKKEYRNIDDRISLIDSHFYVVTYKQPKKLFIFDEEGEFVDESSVESISEHFRDNCDSFMFSTEDIIYLFPQRKDEMF